MQVVSLPGHMIRTGKLASRIAAQSQDNEAAIRHAAVTRWRQTMADGLTAARAARAVGVPRASLYRLRTAAPTTQMPQTDRRR